MANIPKLSATAKKFLTSDRIRVAIETGNMNIVYDELAKRHNPSLAQQIKKIFTVVLEQQVPEFLIDDDTLVAYLGENSVVDIPKNVKIIGREAFYKCSNKIKEVNIPEGVHTIQAKAFYDKGFYITLPESLEVVEEEGCYRNVIDYIPEGLTCVESGAFCYCRSFTEVILPNLNIELGSYAFAQCIDLEKVEVSTPEIEWRAFEKCYNLEEVVLSDVVSIDEAFNGCYKLKKVVLPDTLETMDGFMGCVKLTDIVIPKSVTRIHKRAFENCTNLRNVTIPAGFKSQLGEIFNDNSNSIYAGRSNLPNIKFTFI